MTEESKMEKARTRSTKQRRILLQVLHNAPAHPTAAWIHQEVKKKIPKISLGTVYRNLNILKEQGEVEELPCKGEFSLASNEGLSRSYVTCRVCEKVVDTRLSIDSSVDHEVGLATGFEIRSHCMAFYGRCPECRSRTPARGDGRHGDYA